MLILNARFHKLLRLSLGDWRLLCQTFLLLNGLRFGLRLVPFQSLQRWINHTGSAQSSSRVFVSQIGWAVSVCSRYTPGGVLCLAQALTTQRLMLQSGYDCELKIGVTNPKDAKFEAHAWVEYEGEIIIGNLPDLARFTPLM
jgi:Transglutaminase-like superfamily